MVFHGLRHDLDFFFGEPFPQISVFTYKTARNEVVMLPTLAQADVMTSRNGIHHALIYLVMTGQLHALGDDLKHMTGAMSLVERFVSGDDFGLDVVLHHEYFFGQRARMLNIAITKMPIG